MAEKDVNLVVAGKLGDKMVSALKDKGIDYKEEVGKTVKEMIEKGF